MENQLMQDLPAWANAPRLLHALSKFKSKCPVIGKDKTVEKVGNFGGWGYASLAGIYSVIQPLLIEHQLDYLFLPSTQEGRVTVTMVLFWTDEKESQSISSTISWGVGGKITDLGSVLSYLSRYLLRAMLGLAVDDDFDNDGANLTEPKPPKKGPSVPMAKPTQEVPGVDYHLSQEAEINFKNAQTWADYMDVWSDLVEGQKQQAHIVQMFVDKTKTREEVAEIWRSLPGEFVASEPIAKIFRERSEKIGKKGAGK